MLRSTKTWWLLLSALLVPVFLWLGTGADQSGSGKASGKAETMKDTKKLTQEEERILLGKGTERAFTGKYWDHHDDGTYRCRLCGAPLFSSKTKFDSGTGWPSFDEALPGAVREVPDADGMRTEIVCASCGGHLGHVFKGEGFTDKGVRHCVNSASLEFRSGGSCEQAAATKEAFFAGGCFWGVEYWFEKVAGVLSAESGYMGGRTDGPTYKEVCSGETGHIETVRLEFDPSRTSYEALARLFFEIHDPTQLDRQGPDVGEQYRSAVFYTDEEQRTTAEALIAKLRDRGYKVVTRLEPAMKFWKAEDYHQDYYAHKGSTPYCHAPVKRFGD